MSWMTESRFNLLRVRNHQWFKRKRRRRTLKSKKLQVRKRTRPQLMSKLKALIQNFRKLLKILLCHQRLQARRMNLITTRLKKASRRLSRKLKIFMNLQMLQGQINPQLILMKLKMTLMKRNLNKNQRTLRLNLLHHNQSISLVKTLNHSLKPKTLFNKKQSQLFQRPTRFPNQTRSRLLRITIRVRKPETLLRKIRSLKGRSKVSNLLAT